MNVLSELDKNVDLVLSTKKGFSGATTVEQLSTYIQNTRDELTMLVRVLNDPFTSIGSDLAKEITKDRSNFNEYMKFKSALSNKASSMESKSAYSSILLSMRSAANLLEDLDKHLNEYFEFKRITVLNMRLSHAVISGVLNSCAGLCTYGRYMMSYLSLKHTGIEKTPPYRTEYLEKNADTVAYIVSGFVDKSGILDYKNIIQSMKKAGKDVPLVDNKGKPQLEVMGVSSALGRNGSFIVQQSIVGVPLFRGIGEFINVIRKSMSNYLRQEEDWMRSHVTILVAELNGMDPNDPEYIKLKKVVLRYENIIDLVERIRHKVQP